MKLAHRMLCLCLSAISPGCISAQLNGSRFAPVLAEVLCCLCPRSAEYNRLQCMSQYVEFFSDEMEALIQRYQSCYQLALTGAEVINCLEQEDKNARFCLIQERFRKQHDAIVTESCWSQSEEAFWHMQCVELDDVRIKQCELYGEMIKVIEINRIQRARCKSIDRELTQLAVCVRSRLEVARLQDKLQVLSQKTLP